ncbi:glycosyltransferase family 4 protein [Thalassovita mediterranea]|jgi:glycosyltransferase involved in cell wall biosynthesis|uniref:N-acetylgalactosamine-N, N'-diacetylbacillosaminyl-diphospho-undecaprenol 4-alpha-N-acetylgalactosaminyltransferase n=1 Tax=Thalassovita mediterranea TaxID=340021 RepID=A0A0N7M1U9_9RHOB|nr:glycosyltransferase family 1 protein [Thalassovita mediterranea]CUH84315.1 N-acetylgalactosamine-N, N'-diacetylbacillosaminyl-diphospho-undecaprenol 4-alpha-N-acetylgalactosaminyltransferase [Thalassovita mediterranea]SIS31845.1 Glycosyltransferase involved in cell wall bisynthesis [Thalassovita mediterranea]
MPDRAEKPAAFLLDVTRSLRRVGRLPTGVDRVERAYIRWVLDQPQPVFALARTRLGYVLLDRAGLQAVWDRIEGRLPWGRAGVLSFFGRSDAARRQGESDLRRLALARCIPQRLSAVLAAHLPQATTYLNLGHSNLTPRVLRALRQQGARVVVMLHDLIPLSHPDTQRPQQRAQFGAMVDRVQQNADLILCNSAVTEADVVQHMGAKGTCPQTLVAPLGLDLDEDTDLQPLEMPAGFDHDLPFVMTLGTIEPRKNHALLLDVWDQLAADGVPLQLLICGQRGWMNEEVFRRLDQWQARRTCVFEMAGLSDGQLAWLMQRAAALLFPSVAEGYGLPALEARARGCPVICSDLPVFREGLGNNAVYLPVNDAYSWTITMTEQAQLSQASPHQTRAELARFVPPSWQQHFDLVLRQL